ncbi:MAG: S8 family peptidase [Lewinellaceae bacterium]|nr:S8 family peptidase [Lewinellaceae bacterium]
MKRISLLFIIFFFISEISAQNLRDREFIIRQTNIEKLNQIAEDYWKVQDQFKNKQIPTITPDDKGNTQFFSHFDEEGNPVYFSLENESSAISSKIDLIRTGGITGLDLDGSGIEIGLWDGGSPRTTHQELVGKITLSDSTATQHHATHVSGILIASGIDPGAKGMAPSATIDAFTTSDWQGEIAIWAGAGGMITNHSYILANPQEDYEKYGIYNIYSQEWDELSYNAPYLIMCTGASNNGNKGYNPDNSRYDLLASNKLGKNSIVVGACYDVLDYTGPSSVHQTNFTSWGPTDDWRIKPDITAVGFDSYSTQELDDADYGSANGCSVASPVVAGGLALLQQHYHHLNAVYMKAATAKALILSTTDEAGPFDGPDFSNGWGLFNAKKAADVISNNGITSQILELTLNQDDIYSTTITVGENQSLSVAICWNDPPAVPFSIPFYNNPTPMLINDLDVRVLSDSIEYFPWRMEPNSEYDNYTDAAGKGDNFRDNIEIINVKNIAAGEYTIKVTHKDILQSGSQDFSLIINRTPSDPSSTNSINTFEEGITVYPNPVGNVLNIDFDTEQYGPIKISIFAITGQNQIDAYFDSQDAISIDVSNLPKGIYFLQIQNEDAQHIATKKIIIH